MLLASAERLGPYEIIAPLGSGNAVQITKSGGFIPVESPDGKYLYYLKNSTTGPLFRSQPDGGRETQVLDALAARGYADRRRHLFPPRAGTHAEARILRGKHKSLSPDFSICSPVELAWSPQYRRWILYPRIDRLVEDLMLVENFR